MAVLQAFFRTEWPKRKAKPALQPVLGFFDRFSINETD